MDDSNMIDINEIIDNLEKLEIKLLKIEADKAAGNPDSQDIHISFRFAHNLKSMLAMFGKVRCSKLIHSIESNFDIIRKGKAGVSNELTQNSLLALDLIKLSLNETSEDEDAIAILIDALDAVYTQKHAETIGMIENISLNEQEMEKLSGLKLSGNNIFLLEKLIGTNIDQDTFLTLPIYQDIEEAGVLVAYSPKYYELVKDADECILKILFATKLSEQELQYIIFDPVRKIADKTDESKKETSGAGENKFGGPYSRSLLIEDDFFERRKLSGALSEFGTCDIAFDSSEAIAAITEALKENDYYKIICLGMKSHNSRYSLMRKIRNIEEEENITGLSGSRILVVTDELESKNIIDLYKSYCDMHISRLSDKQLLTDSIRKAINSF